MLLLMLIVLKLQAIGECIHQDLSHPAISACPTWTYPNKTSLRHECICGDSLKGAIECDQDTLTIIRLAKFYCIFYDTELNRTVVGNCPYKYYAESELPKNPLELDAYICGQIHRTGQFCGKCKEDYHFPVYSYSEACIKCDDFQYGWIKFTAAALLPVTFFYLFVVMFRISATSPTLNGYVLVSQLLSVPIILHHVYSANIGTLHGNSHNSYATALIIAVYAIWNLDFFRGFYATLCVHPNLTYYQILMLDYVIALYPLLLIFVTYILVKLHDSNQLIMWLWRPFHKCLFYFRKQWNIHSSLVNAVATFIILSYIKILNVSFQLIIPSFAFNMEGQRINKVYLYYDSTIEMTSLEYLPYLLLAVFMLITFNILPFVLLALYPFQCFQKALNYCCINDSCRLSLNIFMDAFQGCFKNSPRYLRQFAALYLALRFLNHVLSAVYGPIVYLPSVCLLLVLTMALVIKFKPYKSNSSNLIDTVMLFVAVSILLATTMNVIYNFLQKMILFPRLLMRLLSVILLVPPGYAALLVMAKTIPVDHLKRFLSNCKFRRLGNELNSNGVSNYQTFQELAQER